MAKRKTRDKPIYSIEAARSHGKALGVDEVARRMETGEKAKDRVKRAIRYAEWEWHEKHGHVQKTEA